MTGCYSCDQTIDAASPPREHVIDGVHWRVAHSFTASLPGWLVLVPTRHVEALDELSVAEAEEMGRLLRCASEALREVTGCRKTYAILLAEAEGFQHLHVHVVPRAPDLPEDRRGVGVFAYMRETPLTEATRDDVAERLRRAWPPSAPAATPLRSVMTFADSPAEVARWWAAALAGDAPVTHLEGFSFFELDGVEFAFHHDDGLNLRGASPVVYFAVDDVEAARTRLGAAGATLFRGPLEIDARRRICQMTDPFGNVIGLDGP